MRKLIRYELHKLFRQKSFHICSAVIILLPLIFLAALKYTSYRTGDNPNITGWSFASTVVSNSSFVMILGIFIPLFVCEDFDQGILKNIFAKGYGRGRVYVSKYIVSLFGTGLMFVATHAASFVLASILWKPGAVGNNPELIISQGLVLISYHAFYFALAIILGRTGGSIAMGIILPVMVNLLLLLADSLTRFKKLHFVDCWIDSFLNTAGNGDLSFKKHALAVVYAAIYTVVLFLLGLTFHRRKQV